MTTALQADIEHAVLEIRPDKLIEGRRRRIVVNDSDVVVNMNEPTDVEAWLSDRDEQTVGGPLLDDLRSSYGDL